MGAGPKTWIKVSIFFVAIILFTLSYYITEGFQTAKPSDISVDLVIAHYKEDLTWLDEYNRYPFHRVWIYNKSDKPVSQYLFENTIQKSLQNVGGCDHTYLYHIVNNWDNLADITIFIPGSADLDYKKKVLNAIVRDVFSTHKSSLYANAPLRGLLGSQGEFYINRYTLSHPSNSDGKRVLDITPAKERPFFNWHKKWFPNEDSKYVSFWGVFSAARDDIRSRSLSLYQGLLQEVSSSTFPEEAHYIERIWASLFRTMPAEQIHSLHAAL